MDGFLGNSFDGFVCCFQRCHVGSAINTSLGSSSGGSTGRDDDENVAIDDVWVAAAAARASAASTSDVLKDLSTCEEQGAPATAPAPAPAPAPDTRISTSILLSLLSPNGTAALGFENNLSVLLPLCRKRRRPVRLAAKISLRLARRCCAVMLATTSSSFVAADWLLVLVVPMNQ